MNTYRSRPIETSVKKEKKKGLNVMAMAIVVVLGVAMGFLSPIVLFAN